MHLFRSSALADIPEEPLRMLTTATRSPRMKIAEHSGNGSRILQWHPFNKCGLMSEKMDACSLFPIGGLVPG